MRETPHTVPPTHFEFIRESKNGGNTGTIRREDSGFEKIGKPSETLCLELV